MLGLIESKDEESRNAIPSTQSLTVIFADIMLFLTEHYVQ